MAYIIGLGAGDKGGVLLAQWSTNGGHTTSTNASNIADADVVLLDVDGYDLESIAGSLNGKIVIDCNTPATAGGASSSPSAAERIAQRCPGARVVKALNAIDTEALRFVISRGVPAIEGTYTSAFYCADDAQAAQVVCGLLGEVNLDPIDCGGLKNSALLDNLGLLDRELRQTIPAPFAIVVARRPVGRSPLDSMM